MTLRPSSADDVAVTHMGKAIGTPEYMSPEQAAGRLTELGPATDVYCLGATLYSLLTGQPPFSRTDTGEILTRVQQAFDIAQKLAAADPSDAQAQLDIVVSLHKIGSVQQKQKAFEQAIESYGRSLKVLQSLKEQGRLAPANEEWIGVVVQAIQQCKHEETAVGEWKTLLEQPADLLPVLLEIRGTQFVQEGRASEAAQAVAKLRELGTANANQLYNAACVYSLCAARIKAEKDKLTAEQSAERKKHIDDALATLREAINGGFKDFAHIQKD